MSLFNLITNTIEGIAETAVNVVKLPIAVIVSPIDDGKACLDAVDGVKAGIDKIGQSKEPSP